MTDIGIGLAIHKLCYGNVVLSMFGAKQIYISLLKLIVAILSTVKSVELVQLVSTNKMNMFNIRAGDMGRGNPRLQDLTPLLSTNQKLLRQRALPETGYKIIILAVEISGDSG
jgi:hypothetical protein